MNNNYVYAGVGRVCVAAIGAMALWGSVADVGAAQAPQALSDASKFTVFENSEPTSQTQLIKKYLQSEQEVLFETEFSWVNDEIASFMRNLEMGTLPEYSDELLALANEVSKNNPEAFK